MYCALSVTSLLVMKYSAKSEPLPKNPYKVHAGIVCGVAFIALVALQISGWEPSRTNMIPFMIGVMGLTLAFIFGIGVAYGWKGFEARFGSGKVIAYWEIDGQDWKHYAEKAREKLRGKRWFLLSGPIVAAVLMGMALSEGKLMEIVPFAITVGFFISAVIAVVLFLQSRSYSRDSGQVWLAEKGIMANRIVFFSDTFGVNLQSATLREEGDGFVLSISYEVRSGKTVGQHELLIPVPIERRKIVEDTIADWR